MDSTTFGPNWFTSSARALTTGAYLPLASQQSLAANKSSANALSIGNILSQPFFGVTGGLQSLWSKYGSWVLIAGGIWAAVKWVLPLFGIRILWGKGRGHSRRYSHLARARARSLAVRRRKHVA